MKAEEPNQSLQCPHCGAGPFSTRDELRKHIYDAHLGQG